MQQRKQGCSIAPTIFAAEAFFSFVHRSASYQHSYRLRLRHAAVSLPYRSASVVYCAVCVAVDRLTKISFVYFLPKKFNRVRVSVGFPTASDVLKSIKVRLAPRPGLRFFHVSLAVFLGMSETKSTAVNRLRTLGQHLAASGVRHTN